MELAAHEVLATEVRVGDIMDHRTVELSGGLGRVVPATVVDTELFGKDDLEIVLSDNYAFSYQPGQMVVVYRPI